MATVVIKTDRVKFAPLTADPTSCEAGDAWIRQDTGQLKFAIDTVVANAKVTVEAPIETSELADGAVTNAKLADSAVSPAKIENNAIITEKIMDLQVTSAKLANGAVTETKIGNGAVTEAKIADSAISTDKIADGNVTNAKLQYSSLSVNPGTGLTGGGSVALGSSISLGIADGGVGATQLADGAVTEAKLASNAVTNEKIANSAISTTKIADGAVTNAKVASGISPSKIATGNLNLGTGTLTAGEVQVGDLAMRYGWRLKETPDELLFLKDGRIVARLTKQGFLA